MRFRIGASALFDAIVAELGHWKRWRVRFGWYWIRWGLAMPRMRMHTATQVPILSGISQRRVRRGTAWAVAAA